MSLHSVRRRVIAAAALLLVGLAVASPVAMAAEAAAAIPAAPPEISIDNFTFGPNALTVKAGTTVKWTNRDDIPHTIIDKQRKVFRSKVLDTDDSFSFTFNQPGTYEYFCGLHPHMTGQIVVTE
jgi:plastocyanin